MYQACSEGLQDWEGQVSRVEESQAMPVCLIHGQSGSMFQAAFRARGNSGALFSKMRLFLYLTVCWEG